MTIVETLYKNADAQGITVCDDEYNVVSKKITVIREEIKESKTLEEIKELLLYLEAFETDLMCIIEKQAYKLGAKHGLEYSESNK